MTRLHKPLVDKIIQILDEDPRVLAVWLEGSIARGEDDDLSDIDLWISVKDRNFSTFIEEREVFAAKLGPVLSILYPKTEDQPEDLDSFQIILEDQSSTLTIDVDVQKQSRKFKFTQDSAAEECKVLFDKEKIIHHQPFNPQDVEQYARELFEDVTVRFWHRFSKLRVYLQRNDTIEAMDNYWDRLENLVTLLRIMYIPEKADWGFKDLEYDLPDDAVNIIHGLLPRGNDKSLAKLTKKLARTFAKQTKIVGKRLHLDPPRELQKSIMDEL